MRGTSAIPNRNQASFITLRSWWLSGLMPERLFLRFTIRNAAIQTSDPQLPRTAFLGLRWCEGDFATPIDSVTTEASKQSDAAHAHPREAVLSPGYQSAQQTFNIALSDGPTCTATAGNWMGGRKRAATVVSGTGPRAQWRLKYP
jgi:hypothetical protein